MGQKERAPGPFHTQHGYIMRNKLFGIALIVVGVLGYLATVDACVDLVFALTTIPVERIRAVTYAVPAIAFAAGVVFAVGVSLVVRPTQPQP